MKGFLRRAAFAAAMLLFMVWPVKTFASSASLPSDVGTSGGAHTGGEQSGTSTFGIKEVEKWRYLDVTVTDSERGNGIEGAAVTVTPGSGPPITATADGRPFVTDKDGKIEIQLTKDDTINYSVKIEKPGFHPYESPAPFPIHVKSVPVNVSFVPIRYIVKYSATGLGSIPPGEPTEQSVRWGETTLTQPTMPADAPPKVVMSEEDYRFVYWSTADGTKMDVEHRPFDDSWITSGVELEANYALQHLVTYEAGPYGYLSGPREEWVIHGETPSHVPAPLPLTKYYQFNYWENNGSFAPAGADPASVPITGNITFLAHFGERYWPAVSVDGGSADSGGSGHSILPGIQDQQGPEALAESGGAPGAPGTPGTGQGVPGKGGAGQGGSGGKSGTGGHGSNGENQGLSPGDETLPSDHDGQLKTPGQEGINPGQPGENTSPSASGETNQKKHGKFPISIPILLISFGILGLVVAGGIWARHHYLVKHSGDNRHGRD